MVVNDMTDDLNRVKLLGYLMNALDEDELAQIERELLRQPQMRRELAELQEELSPLSFVYESVDPPEDLAQRTCDRIWAAVDKEQQFSDCLAAPVIPDRIVAMTIPIHNNRPTPRHTSVPPQDIKEGEAARPEPVAVLDEIKSVSGSVSMPLADVPVDAVVHSCKDESLRQMDSVQISSLQTSVSPLPAKRLRRLASSQSANAESMSKSVAKHENRRRSAGRRNAFDRETAGKSDKRHWGNVLNSVGLGILLALIAFPAVNYARNQTRTIVTQHKIKELSQGAGVYAAHLQGQPNSEIVEASQGINLAKSDWQEVIPSRIPILSIGNQSQIHLVSTQNSLQSGSQSGMPLFSDAIPHLDLVGVSLKDVDRQIILGQEPDPSEQIELDPRSLAYQTLLSSVGQTVSFNETNSAPAVQSAYGQNILFQNGRVFFRVLPVFDKEQTLNNEPGLVSFPSTRE